LYILKIVGNLKNNYLRKKIRKKMHKGLYVRTSTAEELIRGTYHLVTYLTPYTYYTLNPRHSDGEITFVN